MLFRKSQAALEFLITYGWAILVVIIAIAALAFFGVLNLDAFFPDRCVLPVDITCIDHKVESYRAIIVVKNTRGETMTINKVTVSANNQQCFADESITLSNGGTAIFTITQCNNGATGTKFDGIINITYTIEDKLSHEITGTLRAKITEGGTISSQNICQNAENSGLCGDLDIVYGIGYKQACCDEYSLCCA